MIWTIVIFIVIIFIVIDIVKWIADGIDKSMDNIGLSEPEKHDAWIGLGIWSNFWGKDKSK